MITWSIKLYSHLWHYVLSRIFRNLHFDIEIVRNQGSEELLKELLIFGGGLPYEGYLIF